MSVADRPTPPPARAAVEQLKAYSAPLEGRRSMLRLDFNENTIGPSPLVAQALRNFSTCLLYTSDAADE